MVLPIGSIPAWLTNAVAPTGAAGTTLGTTATAAGTATAGAASAEQFGNALVRNMQNVDSLQANADQLANQVATGKLQDIHDYMIASTEASVATELTVAVRNKAVEAFNDIMRMQI